jgi:serine/threonine protein kinase
MAKDGNGVCPHCQAYTGPVGTPCVRPDCAKGGYHCIPIDWYDAAKAYSARKGRPIDPHVGRMIERYLLAGNLGEGGMGSVYVAIQKPLFREVALKIIGDLDLTRHAVGRFEREARAISLLDHPNILKIFDYGVGQLDKKVPYMALEYLRHGRTLRKAFAGSPKAAGKVDGALVLTLFRQVLNALGAAHAVGIVHRDIKPENVMVVPVHGDPNLVKVLDFGLARMDSDESTFEGDQAAQGRLAGTPYYMAPEQIPKKGVTVELDGRADLFAVAVMLFEIMTGTRPYDGDSPLAVLAKKLDPSFDPMALPETRGLTKKVTALLARGLARDPAQRFATAAEMLEALEKALEPKSSAMGLVMVATGSSQDRIETPATPPADAAPEGSAPAPAAPPPPPLAPSPFVPQGRFAQRPGALEVDIPESVTSPLPTVRGGGVPAATPSEAVPRARPESLARPERPSGKSAAPKVVAATGRWILPALVGAGVLAGLLALVPWVLTEVRTSRAESDMASLRVRLVRGDRFAGFEDKQVRPEGPDYVVLGRPGASGAGNPVQDPWGNAYRVHFQLDRNTYVLRSNGPDGEPGSCRGDEAAADDLCLVLGGR